MGSYLQEKGILNVTYRFISDKRWYSANLRIIEQSLRILSCHAIFSHLKMFSPWSSVYFSPISCQDSSKVSFDSGPAFGPTSTSVNLTLISSFCTMLIKLYNCTRAYFQRTLYDIDEVQIYWISWSLDLLFSQQSFSSPKQTIKLLFSKSYTDLHLI